MLSTALVMSCDSEDSAFTISVVVEGATRTFECNRNAYAGGGNEYSVSCMQGSSARLGFVKEYDQNGGLITITYSDVPNTAFFDSGYGIHYSCDTTDDGSIYEPYCTGNQPTYDSTTSTLTLSGVTLPAGTNNTNLIEYFPGDDLDIVGDGIYVDGRVSTTLSTTIVLENVPFFQ